MYIQTHRFTNLTYIQEKESTSQIRTLTIINNNKHSRNIQLYTSSQLSTLMARPRGNPGRPLCKAMAIGLGGEDPKVAI